MRLRQSLRHFEQASFRRVHGHGEPAAPADDELHARGAHAGDARHFHAFRAAFDGIHLVEESVGHAPGAKHLYVRTLQRNDVRRVDVIDDVLLGVGRDEARVLNGYPDFEQPVIELLHE
jgi:hypothetical protein